jgi:hypothetical protein
VEFSNSMTVSRIDKAVCWEIQWTRCYDEDDAWNQKFGARDCNGKR